MICLHHTVTWPSQSMHTQWTTLRGRQTFCFLVTSSVLRPHNAFTMSFWTPTALDGGGGVTINAWSPCNRGAHVIPIALRSLTLSCSRWRPSIWLSGMESHVVTMAEKKKRTSPVKVWTVVAGKLLRCKKIATSSFDHAVKLQLPENALCFGRFEVARCSTFGVITVPNRLLRVAFSPASITLVPRRY